MFTTAAVLLTNSLGTAALSPKVTVSGKIRLSLDGAGTNADCSDSFQASNPSNRCYIRAQKQSVNSTVKRVFVTAASTGSTGYAIQNGDVKLDGVSIIWEGGATPTQTTTSIGSYNVWAELTAANYPAIFSKLNAAPPGLVSFLVTEDPSPDIDGEILVVIWDDPTAPQTTVSLMYGAQSTLGDSFAVTLAQPVDKTNPATVLDMSLGISYGYQVSGQYSILELGINGTRISTSAGGQDDGGPFNGGLITVGGIGDTNDNPANPYYTDSQGGSERYDDELYNLLPFVSQGATSFVVSSSNPSNDDNIFFAAIVLGNNTAAVGEGLTLAPASQTSSVGTNKTVQATVQNASGSPIVGRNVTFTVTSGVNGGLSATVPTGAGGVASHTYSSSLAGSDTIIASMTNSDGNPQQSNSVTISWQGVNMPSISVALTNPNGETTPVNQNYTLNARVVNSIGQPQVGVPVTFTALSGPAAGTLGTSNTNASGIASQVYTSSNAGTDTLQASIAGPVNSTTITHAWQVVSSPTLVLGPEAQTNPMNGRSTMRARALDAAGSPVSGVSVTFQTSSGPNHSKTQNATTGADGVASTFYSSTVAGTDTWSASTTIGVTPVTSGNATSTWSGKLCDVDNNNIVNLADIQAIMSSFNQPALAGDRRDANFDGVITTPDAVACRARCTNMACQ